MEKALKMMDRAPQYWSFALYLELYHSRALPLIFFWYIAINFNT